VMPAPETQEPKVDIKDEKMTDAETVQKPKSPEEITALVLNGMYQC
jgi:hypothetical protein